MNSTDTHPAPRDTTARWTAARAFRITVGIVLGVLAALVASFAIVYLLFGPSGDVALESEVVVEEVGVDRGTDPGA